MRGWRSRWSLSTSLPSFSPSSDPHSSSTGPGPTSVHRGQAACLGSLAGPRLAPGSLISLRKVFDSVPRLSLNGALVPGAISFLFFLSSVFFLSSLFLYNPLIRVGYYGGAGWALHKQALNSSHAASAHFSFAQGTLQTAITDTNFPSLVGGPITSIKIFSSGHTPKKRRKGSLVRNSGF